MVEIPAAAPVAIVAGLPARFRSVNEIGLPPAREAVASKLPATVFAVMAGAVAMPELFVVSTAWLAPPAKLAPASAAPRAAIAKVTAAPTTGPPPAPRTRTLKACA